MYMYARQLACNGPFNFLQEDITQIRRHMIIELLLKKLINYLYNTLVSTNTIMIILFISAITTQFTS